MVDAFGIDNPCACALGPPIKWPSGFISPHCSKYPDPTCASPSMRPCSALQTPPHNPPKDMGVSQLLNRYILIGCYRLLYAWVCTAACTNTFYEACNAAPSTRCAKKRAFMAQHPPSSPPPQMASINTSRSYRRPRTAHRYRNTTLQTDSCSL
jgi:hypothetical protein